MHALIVRQTHSEDARWTSIALSDEHGEKLGTVRIYESLKDTLMVIHTSTVTAYSQHELLLSNVVDTLMTLPTDLSNLSGLMDILTTNHPELRVLVV